MMGTETGARVLGQAGRFTVYETGAIEGPADYMAERFNADRTMETAKLFRLHSDEPLGQLFAVALQTDYAGWVGMKDLLSRMGDGERS